MGLDTGAAVGNGGRMSNFGSERARPEGGLLASRTFATPRSFEPTVLRVLGDEVLNGDLMPARALAPVAFSGEKVSESSLATSSVMPPSALAGEDPREAAMAKE